MSICRTGEAAGLLQEEACSLLPRAMVNTMLQISMAMIVAVGKVANKNILHCGVYQEQRCGAVLVIILEQLESAVVAVAVVVVVVVVVVLLLLPPLPPTTYCLLPATCYLLPSTCCILLPPTCYLQYLRPTYRTKQCDLPTYLRLAG